MAKAWEVDSVEPIAAGGGWEVAEELPLDAVTKQASVGGAEPLANVYDPASGALMVDNGETSRVTRDHRNAQDDPRRLDRKTGAKIADDVAFLAGRREKLAQANAGTKATPAQIEALAQSEMAGRGDAKAYGLQDRVAGYQAKGMSATEATRNAVFDATLEQRLNEPFQKAKPSANGERIGTDYQPEREAARVKKQGDDLASLRDDIIGRNAAGEMNATWRGATKGGIQSAALTAGTVGFIGDVFGSDALRQWGLEKYDRGMKLANQLTLSKNASDIRSADDLTEWLAENAGYVAYQAAEAIVTGGAGSAIGKQVGKDTLVTAVGLGLNSMRQTLGSVYGEAVEEAKASGKPMPSLLQVFGGAAASAAVDALADKIGLDAITAKGFKGNVLSRVGKSVGSQVAVQGGTEAAQLVPEEWGAGRDPFREGMAKQYFDEAAVGALGGAGPGVLGAATRNPQDLAASELARALTTEPVPSEAERSAAVDQERVKLASLRAGAIADIGAASSVDEAIAAAQLAINLPTEGPLERMSKRVKDADLLSQALGAAGVEQADAPAVAPMPAPDTATASAPEPSPTPIPSTQPAAAQEAPAPMVMGRPAAELQTGQLLQVAKSAMFPEPVREVARQEVKRREIEAMYAQRAVAPQAKAAEEQAIVEAVRDERVEQAEALTSAQTVDAPTAMQLAFQRAQAQKAPTQPKVAHVQDPASAPTATQAGTPAAPTETAAPARADGAAPARVSQPGAAAGVEADGVALAPSPIEGRDLGDGWAEFSPESGTKGVPRAQMPQIKAAHRGAMVNFMNARGVAHHEETVPAGDLKPTQAEFSREKVARAAASGDSDRSILVSQDGHVLDGHHQWMAARERGEPVKVIRLGAPIDSLIELAHEFPSSTVSHATVDAASINQAHQGGNEGAPAAKWGDASASAEGADLTSTRSAGTGESVPDEKSNGNQAGRYSRGSPDGDIQMVVDSARQPGHAPQKAYLGEVSPWLAESAAQVGLQIDGFRHVLDGSAVRHTIKNHYDEKAERSRGQVPVTDADLLALPDVINEPDRVIFGTTNRLNRDQVGFVKKMPDGSVLYLEEIRTGRKELAAVSMRKYPATMNVDAVAATLHPNARGDGGNGPIVLTPPAVGNEGEAYSRPLDAETVRKLLTPMPARMSVGQVQAEVDAVSKTWKSAPPIRVVDTVADLPFRNPPANARGAYDGRTIWVVAANHRSPATLRRTIAHEAVAHAGLRGMLGEQDFEKLLRTVKVALQSKNKALMEIQADVRRIYVDDKGNFNLSEQSEMDEIIARATEEAVDLSTGKIKDGFGAFKTIYSRIAEWLRNVVGLKVPFSMTELHGFLLRSEEYLNTAPQPQNRHLDQETAPVMASDEDGVDFARGGTSAARFHLDPENWRGKTRRVMQDYFLRVRRVQEAIASQGGLVDETTDTYLAEELSYGRIQESLKDFANKMVKPMIEKAQAAGIDMDELALYAYAKHAKERNAQIANIDPKMPDGGSGMTDAEADAILAKAAPKRADFESLHADLMAMTATTRQTLWQEGLITEDEFNALDSMYDNYVPLRGFELKDDDGKPSGMRAGKGFNVRGKETMRALGRQSRAGDVIENIIADYERAVVRAERNQVGKVFLNFVLQNPDASLWEVDATRTKKALDRQTGLVARDTAIEKGEDTIAVKVAGREVYIQIHDDLLARAMRNTHKDETGEAERALIKAVGMYATLMRNTLTRFNPEFALVNTIRDFGFGTAAALDKLGEKGAAKFMKHYAGAYAASARAELGKSDPSNRDWDRWYEEYRAAGGTTGGFYTKGADEIRSDIRTILLQAGASPKDWKEKVQASGPMQLARAAGRVLEFAGAASENAARVAAYRAAREMGKSPSEAASIAKNLTTNFNRRGEAGQLLNSLFVFYNAAIQGAQRTAAMLKNPKMQGYLAAGTAGALALALANATAGGDDEDDGQAYWDKIPDYVKERNLIIMLPPATEVDGAEKVGTKGRYIAIPVQYGLNIFTVVGYNVADLIRHSADETRGKSWLQAGARIASTVFDSFNPFGSGMDNVHSAAMTVMPSVLDVVYQYAAGVNGFGRPTSPGKSDTDTSPDSENVNARQSGGIAHRVARWVNSVTGGDEAEPGLVDVAPGTLEQTWRNLTGGTGMFIGDVLTIAAKQIDDQFGGGENDYFVRDIPIFRKVYGEADGDVDQSLFYERRRQITEARTVEKRKAELGRDFTDRRQVALASMATDGNKFARALSGIRKEMIAVGKDDEMSDSEKKVRLRELKVERDDLTREFNRLFMDTMRDLRDGVFDADASN